MKSFPFDSQVTYDSQGNPSYDRSVNSSDLAENIALLYTNGVLTNPSTSLQAVESESQMSIQVLPGACCINGRLAREDVTRTIVFEAADSANDRIDRVVLRLNTNVDVRAIDIYVLKGTASSTPTAPALTRTGGIYELGIADVFIAKNTSYISAARITDTRMSNELCGYMLTNPQSIDSETIFNQYQAALDDFLDFANDCISGTVVGEIEESFAPLYSTTKNYAVGDFCSYNGKFYVCKTATSGAWDSSKWIRANVGSQLTEISSNLSEQIITRSATVSLGAMSSGTNGYKSVTLPTVDGYTPILVNACISKVSTVKGNVLVNVDYSGNTAYVVYRAFATVSEADSTVVVKAIYKKA